MLTAHNLTKSYEFCQVLDNVTFSLNAGQRVGLIGPNGCGKTTMVRILAGLEAPDSGHVSRNPNHLRTGYLAQAFAADPHQTLGALLDEARGGPRELTDRLANLANKLAADPGDPEVQGAFDTTLRRLESLDTAEDAQQEGILEALGLAALPPESPVSLLSGGQKTRLGLALVLLSKPQLLLLDEPTNHLDIAMLEWLENWLLEYSSRQVCATLIISHDRVFLDRTVTSVLDMDPVTHSIREFPGNYSDYVVKVRAEHSRQMAAYQDQVYEIRRMRQDIARTKQQSLRVEMTTTSRQPGVRRIAKKVAKKAKTREKKLEHYLTAENRVEKPKAGWQLKLAFSDYEHHGQDVLAAEEAVNRLSRLSANPGRSAFLDAVRGTHCPHRTEWWRENHFTAHHRWFIGAKKRKPAPGAQRAPGLYGAGARAAQSTNERFGEHTADFSAWGDRSAVFPALLFI